MSASFEDELQDAFLHQTEPLNMPPEDFKRRMDLVRETLAAVGSSLKPGPNLVIRDVVERRVHHLSGPAVIGTAPECDVPLSCEYVSRRHCCVRPADEDWVVEDLGSTNGTYVNGCSGTTSLLRDGDVVIVGRATLLFLEHKGEPGQSPAT